MARTAGYLVDLGGLRFDESGNKSWIQAVPEGTYEHPVYGTMVFDSATIKDFESNINNDVRVAKLDIDYEHKANGGEAAGWIEKAEARADGLWILVDWTKKAAELIKEKAYRYFSPEIVDEWTDPKSGQTFKNLIFGGGITNRPFLRDILPMNLSEAFINAGNQPTKQEGKSMNKEQRKTLAEKLGLPENVADDVFFKKLEESLDAKPAEGEKKEGEKPEEKEDDELKELSEKHPAVKRLMDIVNIQGPKLLTIEKKLAEAEVKATVATLSKSFTEKGVAIAPVALESLEKALMEAPSKELSEAVIATFTSIADSKVVKLGEIGKARISSDGNSATVRYQNAIKKLMEENPKMSYSDAATTVASQDAQLFEEYREESTAGREN